MNAKIKPIAKGANVTHLLWLLQANEQLWNQRKQRSSYTESPHIDVDDIWVRYAADELVDGARAGAEHESIWYPSPILETVKSIVYPLMQFVGGDRLGTVLITRVPAGKEVKPHVDSGWHAGYYSKFAIQVQSAPSQMFCFEDAAFEAMPGDIYTFNNLHTHWVTNPTRHDRITLIVCIKTDREF